MQTHYWDNKAITHECFHIVHKSEIFYPVHILLVCVSFSPFSGVFPSQQRRHDKLFPTFPQSKPVQTLPQCVCQLANHSVSQSRRTSPARMLEPRVRARSFIVSDFICITTWRQMWKSMQCHGEVTDVLEK